MNSSVLVNLTLTLKYFWSVFVHVHLSGIKLIIDNIYRPPNSDIDLFSSKFFEVLTYIMQLDNSCSSIIMSDINIDFLKVSTNTRFMEYYIIMTSFIYFLLIHRPTRVTDQTQILYEHIWTKELHTNLNSGIAAYDLSDNFSVFAVIKENIFAPHNESPYVIKNSRLNNEVSDSKFRELRAILIYSLLIQRSYRRFPSTSCNQCKRLKKRWTKLFQKQKKYYFSTKLSCCARDPKKIW